MIDIHTHVLPGIDDGAKDMDEAVRMCRVAAEEGITVIIATPHHSNGKYDNPAPGVHVLVQELNEALIKSSVPLNIVAGQEIRINRRLIEDMEKGRSLTLNNSRYLLLELPSSEVPSYTEDIIHELRILGKTPVIAHPERNLELASNTPKLQRLIQLGALTQLTTHSINGAFGSKLQRKCVEWCRFGLVHFISSDAHNLFNRSFGLNQAYQLIADKIGPTHVKYYQENASRLINNESIPESLCSPQKKKWFFW